MSNKVGRAASAAAMIVMAANTALAEEVAGKAMTFKEIVGYGGWVLYVIAAISVFTVAWILWLWYAQRNSKVAPRPLVRDTIEYVRNGAMETARKLCEDEPCAYASTTLAALDCIRAYPDANDDMLKEIISGEGGRQASKLQAQPEILADVTAVAPMLGLLGTVLGMLKAFTAVAGDIAAAKPVLLASGVSHALITTIAGLMVAIPAHIFYSCSRNKANTLSASLETAAQELLTALSNRKK